MKSSLSDKDKERENERERVLEKARQAALRKLSARDRTEKEIGDFLREAGCSAEEVAKITEEFREWGYLDDEKYCRRYFEYGRSRGKASARIIKELAMKGISAERTRSVLEAMKEEAEDSRGPRESAGGQYKDDKSTALSVGMKMVANQVEAGKPVDDRFLARVGRRLAGLGYDSGTCYYVIGKIRSEVGGCAEAED